MPQSKNSQKGEYTQNKKMSRILVGAISFASFAIGIYFAFTQNYSGSALFLLLPVVLIVTLVRRSKRKRDENAQPRKKKEDEEGITDAINDWLGIK